MRFRLNKDISSACGQGLLIEGSVIDAEIGVGGYSVSYTHPRGDRCVFHILSRFVTLLDGEPTRVRVIESYRKPTSGVEFLEGCTYLAKVVGSKAYLEYDERLILCLNDINVKFEEIETESKQPEESLYSYVSGKSGVSEGDLEEFFTGVTYGGESMPDMARKFGMSLHTLLVACRSFNEWIKMR